MTKNRDPFKDVLDPCDPSVIGPNSRSKPAPIHRDCRLCIGSRGFGSRPVLSIL